MNAAARDINQTNFFHGHWMNMRISYASIVRLSLMLVVLISAFAVIYVTNDYRLTLSKVESSKQVADQLNLRWGQLLLEQASLARPSRVELLATEQLKMHLPSTKHMIRLYKK
ncbi:MAG: cell division protein FtsL [Gammaproteobacteria bacterium]|nr:cell division protein FtsL [Gammaproteobacteria bacterium]